MVLFSLFKYIVNMAYFNRDNRSGGNRGFGGGRSFGGGDRGGFAGGERPMFQAVCSKCGNDCEVPFKPTGARPVFCSNCFEHEGKVSAGGGFGGGNKFAKPSFGGGNFNPVAKSNEQFKAQFDTLNFKLDKIIKALAPTMESIEPHEEVKEIMFEAVKEEKKEKTVPAKKLATKKASTKKKK